MRDRKAPDTVALLVIQCFEAWLTLLRDPFLIQPEQTREDFIVSQDTGAPVITPAVSFSNDFIQVAVGVVKPSWAGVVEVGQGALLEFLRRFVVLGKGAVGVSENHLRHAVDQVIGGQPVFPKLVQSSGGGGNRLRIWMVGIVDGRDIWGKPIGKRERLKSRRRRVARPVLKRRTHTKRPKLMETGLKNSK